MNARVAWSRVWRGRDPARPAWSHIWRGRDALPRVRRRTSIEPEQAQEKGGITITGWNGLQTCNAGRAGAHPYRATCGNTSLPRHARERIPTAPRESATLT